jgi:GGDEF domain-containing protein
LQKTLRTTDTISRLAGWRFATLNEEIVQHADIEIIIKRVLSELSKPYKVGDEMIHIEFFAGAAVLRSTESTPDDLMLLAEVALQKAIDTGEGGRYFITEGPLEK